MTLVIGHLQFELNVISNVGILPHQEFNTERKLTISELFMELILKVLSKLLRVQVGRVRALITRCYWGRSIIWITE